MVTALRPTRIMTFLFAVIDAIHSEVFPTLHQPALDPLICPYLYHPCLHRASSLTGSERSGRKIRVWCSVMAFCGLRDGLGEIWDLTVWSLIK